MSFKERWKKVFGDVTWDELDHKKVYAALAVVLAVIILVIVLIVQAVSGGETKKDKNNTANAGKTETEKAPEEAPAENPLEVDAYPEINDVVFKYFYGLSEGDIDLVRDVVDVLTDEEIQTIETKKEYVEAYKHLVCYTKKGLEEGSYVAFVSYDMKILNIETLAPGMMPLYLKQDEAGKYYIFNDQASEELQNYVLELSADEEISSIIADIQARYEQALTEDAALAEFDAKIHESQQPAGDEPAAEETPEEPSEDAPVEDTPEEPAAEPEGELSDPVSTVVTTNVRVRAERSASSELLFTIAGNTGVKVYAHYSDGWSKVEYDGTVGYCKTEYLEAKDGIPTITVEGTPEEADAQPEVPAAEATALNKKMRLSSTVRIRKERSADSGRIANGYQGEYVQAIESYSDGWCKVEYNGKTGYCQTKYLEDV